MIDENEDGCGKADDLARVHEETERRSVGYTTVKHRSKTHKRCYFCKLKNGVSFFTLVFVGVYTAITGFIWYAAQKQINALLESNKISHGALVAVNRAWITADSFDFIKPIDTLDGPGVLSYFRNVGREPALDVKTSLGLVAIPLEKPVSRPRDWPESSKWAALDKASRAACLGNSPFDGAMAVFPSAGSEGNLISGPPVSSFDKTANAEGHQLLVAIGCVTYRTFDEVHHTGFCQFASRSRTVCGNC